MKPWMRRTEKNELRIKAVCRCFFFNHFLNNILTPSGSLSNLQSTFTCTSHMTLTTTRWDKQASNYKSQFIDEARGRYGKWLDHHKWQDEMKVFGLFIYAIHHSLQLQVSAKVLIVCLSQVEHSLLYSPTSHTLPSTALYISLIFH